MANWNLPTAVSDYLEFVTEINDKFVDAGTINYGAPTNLPEHAMRFNRSTNIFEELIAAAWVPKVIGLAGGGTGGTTPAEIITSLGLGSMATQNSNAVNITGGSITGVNFSANSITSGILALARGGTGASLALGAAGTVMLSNGSGVVFAPGTQITELNASNLTTGIIPNSRFAGVGLLASTNHWTATNIFIGQENSAVTSQGTYSIINMYSTNAPADRQYIRLLNYNGDFSIQLLGAGYAFVTNLFTVTAAGVLSGWGSGIDGLNASYLRAGIAHPTRLGSGSPDSSTFLRGDGVWAVPPGGVGGSPIPSGLIAIFDSGCPAGWSRVASMDNRFPIGSTGFGGTGGNTQHRHGVSGNTSSIGSHAHSFSGEGTGKARGLVSGDTGYSGASTFTYDGGGSSRETVGNHYHNFGDSPEFDVEVDVGGNTSSEPGHSHSFSVNSEYAEHYPPYIGVIWCRKD